MLKKSRILKYKSCWDTLPSKDVIKIMNEYNLNNNSASGLSIKRALADAYLEENEKSKALEIYYQVFNQNPEKYNNRTDIKVAGESIYNIYKDYNNKNKQKEILKEIIRRFPNSIFLQKELEDLEKL